MTFRMQKNWRWLVALGAVFVPGVVSGALTLPFKFSAGTPIKAADVNANFEALRAKLDSFSTAPVRPTVGTFTLAGVVTAAPIRKFTQTMSTAWTLAGASAKPQASDVEIVRDLGVGSAQLAQAQNQNQLFATADIVIGNLTIRLNDVTISASQVLPPQADKPQESLTLSYVSATWTYAVTGQPARTVTFNRKTWTGGTGTATNFKYGYAPTGVAIDASFAPISSYTQGMACASAAPLPCGKVVHGPLTLQKGVGPETIDEIARAVVGAKVHSVDLQVFSNATTVSNSVKLTNAAASSVALSTRDDGSFGETAEFNYAGITWQVAGGTPYTWNVAAGTP